MVNNHGEFSSPKDRVVGPRNVTGLCKAILDGGDPNHITSPGGDPPRTGCKKLPETTSRCMFFGIHSLDLTGTNN